MTMLRAPIDAMINGNYRRMLRNHPNQIRWMARKLMAQRDSLAAVATTMPVLDPLLDEVDGYTLAEIVSKAAILREEDQQLCGS